MIRFCTRNQIDDVKWDGVISNSWHETPYGYCWYLDLLAPGWVALIEDDYEMVMPLFARNKYGISYLCQPLLIQYTSLYGKLPVKTDVEAFLHAIPQKFRLWEFNIFLPFEPECQLCSFEKAPNFTLKLDSSYDELAGNYNTNTKRNIKKGENLNVVTINQPEIAISQFLEKINEPWFLELPKSDKQRISQFIQAVLQLDKGKVECLKDPAGEIQSLVLWCFSQTRHLYIFAASNSEAKNQSIMFRLVDSHLRAYAQTGTIIDLEGSSIEGVARFYKGFGAKPVHYYKVRKNSLPKLLQRFKRS